MPEIINTARALTILMRYFDISCKMNGHNNMNLSVKTHDEYAPASDLAVALVDLDNEVAKEDYMFLIGFFSDREDKHEGMTEEDKTDTVGTGINNPDGDYNIYGSKLEDVQEINRLKDENLELKLIIGEMQHNIFKLHKELDEKD